MRRAGRMLEAALLFLVAAGGGSLRFTSTPACSSPVSRSVNTLAEIPGKLARKSENRLPPSISSRTISIDQRSPTSSIAKAVPQAS